MKTVRSLFPCALLALAAVLAGCATPDTRIRQNTELFDRLAPEQQQLIREGRVALGFTPDMVYLAVGEPDRKWARVDADGRSEVWTYTTYESSSGAHLYRGWYHRYHGYRDPLYPYYLDDRARRAREYFKVTFREGSVVLIEEDQRR
jgi:hypothetical protein